MLKSYTETTKTDLTGCIYIFEHTHTMYVIIIIIEIELKKAINLRVGSIEG